MTKDLSELRLEIDRIDSQLVELFEQRLDLAKYIAEAKKAQGKAVFDPEREQLVLASRASQVKNPEYASAVRSLFRQLMELNKAEQRKTNQAKQDLSVVSDYSAHQVLYSGIPGAYAQLAALRFGFTKENTLSCNGFDEVVSVLTDGKIPYAVLPVENTVAGPVLQNIDLTVKYPVKIVDEICLPIEHCLVALPGVKIDEIKSVISHEQALSQCAAFCAEHSFATVPHYNTAAAAAEVVNRQDRTLAAIASVGTAEIYGLDVLAENIGGSVTNTTRFWLFKADDGAVPEKFNKMSLSFTLPHKAGSLFDALSVISDSGCNMTNIIARPIQYCNWQYRFFVDIEGDFDRDFAERFVEKFGAACQSVHVLGHYNSGGGLA